MLNNQLYFFEPHGSHFGFFASTALQLVLHCRWLANAPEVGIANIAIISKIVNVHTNFYQCFFSSGKCFPPNSASLCDEHLPLLSPSCCRGRAHDRCGDVHGHHDGSCSSCKRCLRMIIICSTILNYNIVRVPIWGSGAWSQDRA